MGTCESGNNLTEDGSGLCTRPAVVSVEFSRSRMGKVQRAVFSMCKGCAGHWSLIHPNMVKIIG